jgi:hypothetical protein
MRPLAALLLCALLTTCISTQPNPPPFAPGHIDLYVQPGVPHEWVEDAVADWESCTPARFEIHYHGEMCEQWCWFIEPVTAYSLREEYGEDWWGYTTVWHNHSGKIEVAVDLSAYAGTAVVTHEFGHALGLQHRELPIVSIMNPRPSYGIGRVACADVIQYYQVNGGTPPECVDADEMVEVWSWQTR